MKPLEKIIKSVVDLGETLVITGVIDSEFWQELIISIVVVLFNFLVIPLIKSLFNYIKKKTGMSAPEIPDKIDKDDLKEQGKENEND